MNILKFYPAPISKMLIKNAMNSGITNPEKYTSGLIISILLVSLIASSGLYFLDINVFLGFLATFIAANIFFYFKLSLSASTRIKKMEAVFPDVIQLMASNLRAGMTVDRSFLLSARPEFFPLNQEILKAGKEITTGKDVGTALLNMSKRIGSDKISKTIMLIISSLKAGGNISTLLEQTASNIREKEFIEKRAASNIVMYVIFIFVASGIGAPILFGLSSILVQIIVEVMNSLPAMPAAGGQQINVPFSFTQLDISINFVIYFSIIFLVITNILSSLIIGLVNKGDEKEGLKYVFPLIAMSLGIFFAIRIFLYKFLAESFSLAG